ncbi:MAG: P63C domain-containing protein [Phycisphaerae bacterium]
MIDKELVLGGIIQFKIPGTQYIAHGFEGTLLVDICTKYLEADEQGKLRPSQKKLAIQAAMVIRSCAKVGIIALIDEATGFQQIRAKHSLQLKLQAFIADEMGEWAKLFSDEFWIQLARLEGIKYSPRNRPLRWGRYVMMFVYDAVDKDVGKQLRAKNPNPHFMQNHHQWLKEFGREKVNNHLHRVIGVMQTCDNMDEFRKKFAYIFRVDPWQLQWDDWMRPADHQSGSESWSLP